MQTPIRAPLPRPVSILALAKAIALGLCAGPASADPTILPDLSIQGSAAELANPYRLQNQQVEVDTAELLRQTPGGAVNRNGPLSGIAQYRGLYGDRVHVSIDGMNIASGGPNAMDPPLSYAPAPLLQALELRRGIAPVSTPGESLGGAIVARLRRADHASDPDSRFAGWLSAGGHSVDQSRTLAGLMSLADPRRSLFVAASRQEGADTRFADGRILPTRYARDFYALGASQRVGAQEFSLDLRRNFTEDAGTPALPMDIRFIDASQGRLGYQGQLGGLPIEAWLSRSAVDHEMSNFHLRPPMDPEMLRFSRAGSQTQAWGLNAELAMWQGTLAIGMDARQADHHADIGDPGNAMFFVRNFSSVEQDLYGAFAEWSGKLAPRWILVWGLRYHHARSTAGEVDGSPARMMDGPRQLRDRFNAAQRPQRENNVDWLVQLTHQVNPHLSLELAAARKSRAPSYQERYLWLPLESTAGLADRKRYVGRIDLQPEISHQLELGLQWHQSTA